MSLATDQKHLLQHQYQNASNLNARISLHARFSLNSYGWHPWVFDQFQLPPNARILELGCGSGALWLRNLERIPAGWDITLSDFSTGMVEDARHKLEGSTHPFTFQQMDAQSIPLPDASVDAVIANHMLYHVPDRNKAFSEIRRASSQQARSMPPQMGFTICARFPNSNCVSELGRHQRSLRTVSPRKRRGTTHSLVFSHYYASLRGWAARHRS